MQVKDLRKKLEGIDDELMVLIPMSSEFDGYFKHPCLKESGVMELGVNENLGLTKQSFVLVPCGFFDIDHEEEKKKELN